MKRMFLMGFLLLCSLALLFGEEEKAQIPTEKKIALPIVLNLIPGFGIGSFTQGDSLGGAICLVGDLVGGGLMVFGVFGTFGYLAAETASFTTFEGEWDFKLAQTAIVTGMVIFLATKTFGIIRPIWYATSYNRKLREGRISVHPDIQYSPSAGEGRVSPGIRLTFRWN